MRKLSSLFDAINGANFNTKPTEGTLPGINHVFIAVGDNGILRTNKLTVVARDAYGRDF